MRFFLASLALTTLAASARPADACSAPPCWPGAFVPGDNATIPENAPGLFWRPSLTNGQPPDPSTVRLVRYGDTTPIPLTAIQQGSDWVLVPETQLLAGERYALEETLACNGAPGARVVFQVGPSAPLPTSLGTARLIGHGNFTDLEVATAAGSCSTTVGAMVLQVMLDPAEDIAPWKDLLLYDTLVDGQPWVNQRSINVRTAPGQSWYGRGYDLLYRVCEPNPDALHHGLPFGGHEVAFRATLPGVLPALETPAIEFEVICSGRPEEPEEEDTGDGGCASTTPASGAFVLLLLALLLVHRTRR